MTNNLISRQAVIDALARTAREKFNLSDEFGHYLAGLMDGEKAIQQLPSAQPERLKGKWIPHKEKSREYIGGLLAYIGYDYWFCDACGYRVEKGQPMYNFCPHCGARMDGEEDG